MEIINYSYLENNIEILKSSFINSKPFEHVVIDRFCNDILLTEALQFIPDANRKGVNKSRDFIFAKNKFEKSSFNELTPIFQVLKDEMLSDRFRLILQRITGEDVFIDPDFYGGGLHQGGKGSYLNMHVDFNYHPNHKSWFRNINILLYLNKDWKEEYGGQLKLLDGRTKKEQVYLVEPLFNRAVIMLTRDYTMHGYAPINFPDGQYRRSIAAYGYTKELSEGEVRTTVWYPENGGLFKRMLGRNMPKLVKIKTVFFGSGTSKNK